MRLMGIDLGLAKCGVAVIDDSFGLKLVAADTLTSPSEWDFGRRAAKIVRELTSWAIRYGPGEVALETFGRVVNTSSKQVMMTEGAILARWYELSLTYPEWPAIYPLSPNTIKARVAGYGKASKPDLRRAVSEAFEFTPNECDIGECYGPDAIDAMAGALTLRELIDETA